MSEIIGLQTKFFLASVASGIIMLIVYDTIRILRRIIKHSRFGVAVEDIIFWVLSSLFIFFMMYTQNDGVIRGFSIMGMVLGMVTYNLLLSKYIVNGISFVINKIIYYIKKIIAFILKPFRFILGKLLKVFNTILKKLGNLFRIIFRKLKRIGKRLFKGLKKNAKTIKITITKK